jgi:CubicO group peptidase (beta-lactamase class C family)
MPKRRSSTEVYAVGVIRDSAFVFARGYGLTILEYDVPISQKSPFYIGSMSKQSTTAAVALLVQQRKNRTED